MSTRRDTKYAARRRAAGRKRVRELGRLIFVYAFIGILIIGTVSTIFVVNAPVTTSTVPTLTPTANAALSSLVTNGDAALASGDYNGALSYYLAYSTQNAQDADVLFKIGKVYVDPKNPSPDYLAGVAYLQRAANANPNASWVTEAAALITQYEPQALAAATATANAVGASQTVTGTTVVTGTAVTAPVTGTTVLTK
jgi:tetratricopeptide (TPR) repeat protein